MGLFCLIFVANPKADISNLFEKTLMPGPLSKLHAELEEDCSQCHRLFNKEGQAERCVSCHDHENIERDIREKTGFHGKSPKVKNTPCRDCHTEHEGRGKDIIAFNEDQFEHRWTDFPLDKIHNDVDCVKCHLQNKSYHVASRLCIDCHKKKDIHKGDFGKQCGECHRSKKWQRIDYDHDKSRFKLKLSHRDVECKDCHAKKKYKYQSRDCYACHRKDDKHKSKLGNKCKNCHNEKKWDVILFNHDRNTDYALRWKHRKVKCLDCHKTDPYQSDTPEGCNQCHKKDDEHKGVFGKLCDDCHTEKRWKDIRFNHDNTRYVLDGYHREAECHGCHRMDKRIDLLDSKCIDCHQSVDVHDDVLGKRCESCHVSQGWVLIDEFDHDLSRFPLTGAHVDAVCGECHDDYRYRKTTPRDCKNCHFTPRVHGELFGKKCEKCHFASDWMIWRFSHDLQTEFKLRGRHKQISCFDCHTPDQGSADLPKDCYSCHILNDVHNGEFGKQCGRCHSEKSFRGARVR